jgi:hypothetical protein
MRYDNVVIDSAVLENIQGMTSWITKD